ncbi:hypothetical protein BD414DRAFT_294889 [Trametes punicea]|nr:hypothetical protein BD414DRAFT_294889 [Trametes punicea]
MDWEDLIRNFNSSLDDWLKIWQEQLRQSSGFHSAFIQFFQSHVRLFLNTFGLNLSSTEAQLVDSNGIEADIWRMATVVRVSLEYDLANQLVESHAPHVNVQAQRVASLARWPV